MVHKSQHDEQIKREHEKCPYLGSLYPPGKYVLRVCFNLHPETQVPPAISSLRPEHLHQKRSAPPVMAIDTR